MRKGRLEKSFNHLTNNVDWERFSLGKSCCITVRAYLNAHDKKLFSALAEDNHYYMAFKHGFNTIEEAFVWAESHVDYLNEKILENEITLLKEKHHTRK